MNERDVVTVAAAAAALPSKVRIVKKLLQLVDRNQIYRKMKVFFFLVHRVFLKAIILAVDRRSIAYPHENC